MKPSLFTLKLVGASSLLAFALTGCMRPDKDRFNSEGMNVLLKEEDDNMGEVMNTNTTAAAKTSAAVPDTFAGELNVTWSRGTDGAWIRSAEFIGTNGFERLRQDTVHLLDSNDVDLDLAEFRPALAAKITHHRHVIKSRNGKQVDIHVHTDFRWTRDANGNRVAGVWNGTITGFFNLLPFKNGTISDVSRPFTAGLVHPFGFPTSGYIEVERSVYVVRLTFLDDHSADVTVDNTRNGNHYLLHVSATNVETQR